MKIDCKITENFLREKARICDEGCEKCPFSMHNNGIDLYCDDFLEEYPREAIEIVQKWSDTHPRKTYKEDFYERFPNAEKVNGYPIFAQRCIYKELNEKCTEICTEEYNCLSCWDRIMEE